jgi:hypothetical protein
MEVSCQYKQIKTTYYIIFLIKCLNYFLDDVIEDENNREGPR